LAQNVSSYFTQTIITFQIHGIAYAGFATEQERKSALKKSKSFIGEKQVKQFFLH
jgi:hypothetical protein